MPAPSHRITVDHQTGVVDVVFKGFWTPAHVALFGRELRLAFDAVAAHGKVPVLLSDSSETAVHSPEVVEAMQLLSAELAPWPRKTALLTDGQLYRMQARRIVDGNTALASFSDRDEAIAWLVAD